MQQEASGLILALDDNFNPRNISKQQITSFFENLDTEDKKEVRNWCAEDFVAYVAKENPYVLLGEDETIIAMGDVCRHLDELGLERSGLWLLTTPEIRSCGNAKRLIRACTNVLINSIRKTDTVVASTLAENKTHRAFIEKVLGLELLSCNEGGEAVYVCDGKGVLTKFARQATRLRPFFIRSVMCVSQFQ